MVENKDKIAESIRAFTNEILDLCHKKLVANDDWRRDIRKLWLAARFKVNGGRGNYNGAAYYTLFTHGDSEHVTALCDYIRVHSPLISVPIRNDIVAYKPWLNYLKTKYPDLFK